MAIYQVANRDMNRYSIPSCCISQTESSLWSFSLYVVIVSCCRVCLYVVFCERHAEAEQLQRHGSVIQNNGMGRQFRSFKSPLSIRAQSGCRESRKLYRDL